MVGALATGTDEVEVDVVSPPLDEAAAAAVALTTWKATVGLLLLVLFPNDVVDECLVKFKAAKLLVVLTMVDDASAAVLVVVAFVVVGPAVDVIDEVVSSLTLETEDAETAAVDGSAPPTFPLSSASSVLVDLSAVEHFITGLALWWLGAAATAVARCSATGVGEKGGVSATEEPRNNEADEGVVASVEVDGAVDSGASAWDGDTVDVVFITV